MTAINIKEYTEQELQQLNADKLVKAKEYLGSKWLLHSDNMIGRKLLGEKK